MAEWLDYEGTRQGVAHTVVGTVKVLPAVESVELANQRDILVYLPPSYGRGHRAYPVLYMQDGQNLFDQTTSYTVEWRVARSSRNWPMRVERCGGFPTLRPGS